MGIGRIGRHLLEHRWRVRRIFPPDVLAAIEQAIKTGESSHSGQVRFVVEGALDGAPLFRDQPARERALDIFSQLRIWDTAHNNGVLIYLLLADRDVEIIADRGIDAKVGSTGWEKICGGYGNRIQSRKFQERRDQGNRGGIEATGGALSQAGRGAERTAGCAGGDLRARSVGRHSGARVSANLRCAIAHRGISRFRVRCFASPRNDGSRSPAPSPTAARQRARIMWRCSAVVELVEIAHRLHDRLEIRPRIERVEQLRGVRQQRV
jgi:hypothetical protein